MTDEQERELVAIARERINDDDPSHDFRHAVRILKLAKRIAAKEGGDLDVIIAAALFHDLIVHSKDSPQSKLSSEHSAEAAGEILRSRAWYPAEKIPRVQRAIERCSFSKNLPKETIEEEIVQDADLLESLGALAVARTFCSTGQMHRPFYHFEDPAGRHRELDPRKNALDLFGARLFVARQRLVTAEARSIGDTRDKFLHQFFDQFITEIDAAD